MALVKKINFQLDGAPVPTDYTKDIGAAYDVTRGFGWVTEASLSSTTHMPLSITSYARDRNTTGIEQRLDTLLHMEHPSTTAAAAWEYALPNGTYSVTVSVGDQPTDSQHRISVEGVEAIRLFQPNSTHKYELGTVKVNVTDGKLSVDSIGGTNTKINFIEISSVSEGNHPSVTGSSPISRATGINLNTAVSLDISSDAGVDTTTLNTTNIQLYRTKDNALVPGNINTTGGEDAIVYQPSSPLAANTSYTFRLGEGVKNDSGVSFLPFSTTFTTGTDTTVPPTPLVSFSKKTVYSGAPISSLVISPDGKLYAASLDGSLRRWMINDDGSLSNEQVFNDSNNKLTGRAIIGIAFDTNNPNNLWVTHNNTIFTQPADDFTGKISKLTLNGTNFNADVQDYVVGLPRASKDHLSNSLVFGDGKLYMTQGSNSAMGAPDAAWYNRPERLLNAAVLQIDPTRTPPAGGFNVQTENYVNSSGVTTTGNYNPYATDAPVKIFATGIRNAYDLVWHSNGNLYVPTNGSAAGGNTPDNPATTVNEALSNVATRNDYLFKIPSSGGGYYGHPNPKRNEYILNGGNPTSAVDSAEVVDQDSYNGYNVGINPDVNWKGFAYDFGRNRSPNGAIEYESNKFGGALKNKLLVVEYSGGDDILALTPGTDGNIPRGNVTQVISGLTDPLDLIEDTKKNLGNLYVAELIGGGTSGRISLLS